MKYLFFDIECCDGRRICEFGYVMTDETFTVTDRKCLTINPEAKFNLINRPRRKDLFLAYPESEYYSSPAFPAYYGKIKEILTAGNRMIVGFSTHSDTVFLNDACRRYKLPLIDFPCFDCQKFYQEYKGNDRQVSLDRVQEELNLVEGERGIHRSDIDALQTRDIFKAMCQSLDVTAEDLFKLCPRCFTGSSVVERNILKGEYEGFASLFEALDKGAHVLSSDMWQFLSVFQNVVSPAETGSDAKFIGKTFCLSDTFCPDKARELFIAVQLIANGGGKFGKIPSESDIYIASDADILSDGLHESDKIYKAAEYGLDVYTLEDLYDIIGITKEEIDAYDCSTFCRALKDDFCEAREYASGGKGSFYRFLCDLDNGRVDSAKKRREAFNSFVKRCKPSGEAPERAVGGKIFSITKDMERECPRELFVIYQIIVNARGKLSRKVSETDYCIATDSECGNSDPAGDSRRLSAICGGVHIISIGEFCSMAGYTYDDFSAIRCAEFCNTKKVAVSGGEAPWKSVSYPIDVTVAELISWQKRQDTHMRLNNRKG